MKTYKRLKSILLKNDKKILVNLEEWGNFTLTGDELVQFQEDFVDMHRYHGDLIDKGDLKIEMLYEEVEVEYTTLTLEVGIRITKVDNLVLHPREVYWFDRMSKDPNVIKFNHDEFEFEE